MVHALGDQMQTTTFAKTGFMAKINIYSAFSNQIWSTEQQPILFPK
jgi:hypothetical protein